MTHEPDSHPPAPALASQSPNANMGPREFVVFIAALISLNALAIDIMLPALDDIAAAMGIHADYAPVDGTRSSDNRQQWIIFAYVAGFGAPQLIFGPLTDRFGRKFLLLGSLVVYSAIAIACMSVSNLPLLLAIRFLQGVSAGGVRVIANSIVRDLYSGRRMAQIMSVIMAVFMIVPIMAPSTGQLILLFASWPLIFAVLGGAGLVLFCWGGMRLQETLPAEKRRPLHVRSVAKAYLVVLKTRLALGYMLASGILFGGLFAFIGAAEQLFTEVFHRGQSFTLWFAAIAALMAGTNIMNARLVERYGMRFISHIALVCFTGLSAIAVVLMLAVGESFGLFFPLFALVFGCFGLIGPNFNALAMEPLGAIAGTASAAYGFATTTISAAIGLLIAAQYNGTATPIMMAFVVLGGSAIGIVYITERGRLFRTV